MVCCHILLSERGRHLTAIFLFVFEIGLFGLGGFSLGTLAYIKSTTEKVDEGNLKSAGYSLSGENFLFIETLLSIIIHLCGIKLFYDCADYEKRADLKFLIITYIYMRILLLPVAFASAVVAIRQSKPLENLSTLIPTIAPTVVHSAKNVKRSIQKFENPYHVPEHNTPLPMKVKDRLVGNDTLDFAGELVLQILVIKVFFEVLNLVVIRIFERSNWQAILSGDPKQDAYGYLCLCCGSEPEPSPRIYSRGSIEQRSKTSTKVDGAGSDLTMSSRFNSSHMYFTVENPPMMIPLMPVPQDLRQTDNEEIRKSTSWLNQPSASKLVPASRTSVAKPVDEEIRKSTSWLSQPSSSRLVPASRTSVAKPVASTGTYPAPPSKQSLPTPEKTMEGGREVPNNYQEEKRSAAVKELTGAFFKKDDKKKNEKKNIEKQTEKKNTGKDDTKHKERGRSTSKDKKGTEKQAEKKKTGKADTKQKERGQSKSKEKKGTRGKSRSKSRGSPAKKTQKPASPRSKPIKTKKTGGIFSSKSKKVKGKK